MKALIADDDRISRAVLKRLLSHINVEVVEADNGLNALNLLEQVDPDFIVFDVQMPILSGLEALTAIRQSPVRPDVPVICISASGTKEDVSRMLALGVSDYLLKPINPVEALPRIKSVMLRSTQWRKRRDGGPLNSLLIVDADPNFLAFAKPLLEQDFEVSEMSSGTQAALRFREAGVKPAIVCLSEGLPLVNEDVLADVIRKMAIQDGATPPQIYLLAGGTAVEESKALRFAGVVRKSFVPAQFVEEFRRVVMSDQNPCEKLRRLVREGLRGELVTATQQAIGVMMASEVTLLGDEHEGVEIPAGVCSRVTMQEVASGLILHAELVTGRAEVEKIGSQVLRRPITFDDGGSEVLGELGNTIAGRMRACLLSRGFDLKMSVPEIATDEVGDVPADLAVLFRCSEGQVFRVSLRVEQGATDLIGETPAPAAASDEPPAEAEAAPVLDEALS